MNAFDQNELTRELMSAYPNVTWDRAKELEAMLRTDVITATAFKAVKAEIEKPSRILGYTFGATRMFYMCDPNGTYVDAQEGYFCEDCFNAGDWTEWDTGWEENMCAETLSQGNASPHPTMCENCGHVMEPTSMMWFGHDETVKYDNGDDSVIEGTDLANVLDIPREFRRFGFQIFINGCIADTDERDYEELEGASAGRNISAENYFGEGLTIIERPDDENWHLPFEIREANSNKVYVASLIAYDVRDREMRGEYDDWNGPDEPRMRDYPNRYLYNRAMEAYEVACDMWVQSIRAHDDLFDSNTWEPEMFNWRQGDFEAVLGHLRDRLKDAVAMAQWVNERGRVPTMADVEELSKIYDNLTYPPISGWLLPVPDESSSLAKRAQLLRQRDSGDIHVRNEMS